MLEGSNERNNNFYFSEITEGCIDIIHLGYPRCKVTIMESILDEIDDNEGLLTLLGSVLIKGINIDGCSGIFLDGDIGKYDYETKVDLCSSTALFIWYLYENGFLDHYQFDWSDTFNLNDDSGLSDLTMPTDDHGSGAESIISSIQESFNNNFTKKVFEENNIDKKYVDKCIGKDLKKLIDFKELHSGMHMGVPLDKLFYKFFNMEGFKRLFGLDAHVDIKESGVIGLMLSDRNLDFYIKNLKKRKRRN